MPLSTGAERIEEAEGIVQRIRVGIPALRIENVTGYVAGVDGREPTRHPGVVARAEIVVARPGIALGPP